MLYLFYCAIGVLVKNFRSLIDLPLPEADQHKILKTLVEDFDNYEGIGNFYTQLSGSTCFVQLELYFLTRRLEDTKGSGDEQEEGLA